MDKNKLITIVSLSVLSVAVVVFVFLFFNQRKANSDMLQLFELDKEEMENEYSNFALQYDELQMTISNDSLYHLLEQEKVRTQRLLEELRTVKASNAQEITRLKKELATVRAVMRTYVIQIDSLNRINEALTQENKQVKQQYTAARQEISSLSEERKNLNQQVKLAAQLDATGIVVTPKNKRGKAAKKVKDIVQLTVDFTITKNITAPTGERTLYIRIVKPDNGVLTKNEAETFTYENRSLGYSIKKYIEYTGEEQAVTVYWNVEEFLYAGEYRAEIFADGTLIGSQRFTLN